jgi:CRISPR-associated protein Csy1
MKIDINKIDIPKFVATHLKSYIDEQTVKKGLDAKASKALAEELKSDYEPVIWIEKTLKSASSVDFSITKPSKNVMTLYSLLSIYVGYGRNLFSMINDEHEFLTISISGVDKEAIQRWKSYISDVKASNLEMFIFFYPDIVSGLEYKDVAKNIAARVDVVTGLVLSNAVVSHSAKFSDPSARFPKVLADIKHTVDGFIHTGCVNVPLDMHVNATDLQVFKFINFSIGGVSLLDLFSQNKLETIEDYFGVSCEVSASWQKQILPVLGNEDHRTHKGVSQVYFPVEDAYHQLSLLSASPLMFTIKERIDQINSYSNATYTGKNSRYKGLAHKGYSTIPNLTVQRHGGDHPKNISGLNNKHQNVYLLPSIPPTLKGNDKLPTYDFFQNIIWPKKYLFYFNQLQKQLLDERNNFIIRNNRDSAINNILTSIVHEVWKLRQEPHGWSERERFDALPEYQKSILDGKLAVERNDKHIESFTMKCADWIMSSYVTLFGDDALPLAQDEFEHILKLSNAQAEAL